MGASVKDARQRGSRPKGVVGVLHHSDPGGIALLVGDVGVNGADGEGSGQFPVQGFEEYQMETAAEKEEWDMDLPSVGGSNKGDRNGGDKNINSPEA